MAEPLSSALTLRPQTARDALQLSLWLTDPAAEWRQWDAPYLHGELLSDDDLDVDAEEPPHERLICLGAAPIGLVTRHPEPPRSGGWWELGILIYDPRYWSGGLGTQALRQWTRLTFEETGAHVLTLATWSGNARMLRAGAKAGYRECARVRQARLWRGERYDSVRLDLLRSEWEEGAEPKNE